MPPKQDKKAPPPPKKKPQEPPVEEGLPLWMATFADMVTLLLCFFVLLLSFAQQDANKFKTLMGSIKEAFGVQLKRKEAEFAAFSPSQFERKDVQINEDKKQLLGLAVSLKKTIMDNEKLKKTTRVATEEDGVVMRIRNEALFTDNSARLIDGADDVILEAIKVLQDHNFNLVIRSNTDDAPSQSQQFPSAWELTAARSATILHFIVTQTEIPATRIKAVGYANSHPLVPNNSAENRALNRRVEFFFHPPSLKSW